MSICVFFLKGCFFARCGSLWVALLYHSSKFVTFNPFSPLCERSFAFPSWISECFSQVVWFLPVVQKQAVRRIGVILCVLQWKGIPSRLSSISRLCAPPSTPPALPGTGSRITMTLYWISGYRRRMDNVSPQFLFEATGSIDSGLLSNKWRISGEPWLWILPNKPLTLYDYRVLECVLSDWFIPAVLHPEWNVPQSIKTSFGRCFTSTILSNLLHLTHLFLKPPKMMSHSLRLSSKPSMPVTPSPFSLVSTLSLGWSMFPLIYKEQLQEQGECMTQKGELSS